MTKLQKGKLFCFHQSERIFLAIGQFSLMDEGRASQFVTEKKEENESKKLQPNHGRHSQERIENPALVGSPR